MDISVVIPLYNEEESLPELQAWIEKVMNENGFGGNHLYISSINDALYGASYRWNVTVTSHLKESGGVSYPRDLGLTDKTQYQWEDGPVQQTYANPQVLFDGNAESYLEFPANTYLKVSIDFDGGDSVPSYVYGTFYASFYNASISRHAKYRCYVNYEPHGIGWKEYDFVYYKGDENSTYNVILQCVDEGDHNRSKMEFIVFGGDSEESDGATRLSILEWKLSRGAIGNIPVILGAKGANKIFTNLGFYNKGQKTLEIYAPNGDVTGTGTMQMGKFQSNADLWYDTGDTFGLNLNNSDLIGANGIYFRDASDTAGEGINFYRDSTHFDTLRVLNGKLQLAANREKGTTGTFVDIGVGGASEPYVQDLTWTQSAEGYTCTVAAQSHGKGYYPRVEVYEQVSGSTFYELVTADVQVEFDTGNIIINSAKNIVGKAIVR